MKYFLLIMIILFTFSCSQKPILIHKEQLILDVPQELLIEPKELKTL
jgi:hypothetical protein